MHGPCLQAECSSMGGGGAPKPVKLSIVRKLLVGLSGAQRREHTERKL